MEKEFLMNLEGMTEEVAEAILEEQGKITAAWEQKLRQEKVLGAVGIAIAQAQGRSGKAITALLDLEALCGAEDVEAAAKQAVETVKKENGYLFAGAPGFAPGAGAVQVTEEGPTTLSEALKEKFAGSAR